MQVHGAAQGVGTTIPRRGRRLLEALLAIAAIVVIVAVMALMTRGVLSPATGGLGAQDADLKAGAGTAVVHDDAGNMPMDAERAAFYQMRQGAVKNTGIMHASMVKDMGQMRGTGSAVVHDDAGNVKPR